MRWTWMSVVAALLIAAAIPAGATVTIDSTNATPSAAASAKTGASQWRSALFARVDCLGTASITFGQLSGRKGEYNTRSGVVTIDPDVDAADVVAVVIHELAHHAHLRCGGYSDPALAAAFNAAQGLPIDRGWFDYSAGWGQTPAEVFAEAVTVVVLGSSGHGISVTPAALDLVSRWMQAQSIPTPVATPMIPAATAPKVGPVTSRIISPLTSPTTPPTAAAARSRYLAVRIGQANECGPACLFVGDFAAD